MIYENEVKVIQFYDYMYTETRECGQILNNYVHLTICFFFLIFSFIYFIVLIFLNQRARVGWDDKRQA